MVDDLRLGLRSGSGGERLIQITEGVVPEETWGELEPVTAAIVESDPRDAGAGIALRAAAGAGTARVRVAIPAAEQVLVELRGDPEPFRLEAGWRAADEERLTGLGARHGLPFDQRGRRIRLGADRRYTGPDCPQDMLAEGGIPQGDYVPAPWLLSSAGWALWAETWGPGLDLDLAGPELSLSQRGAAGPLRLLSSATRPRRHACGGTCG